MEKANQKGRFGEFGGAYIPELLVPAMQELEKGFNEAIADKKFIGAGLLPVRICWQADTFVPCKKPQLELQEFEGVFEEGGPASYWRAQNQQYPWPGLACKKDGEKKAYRGNRRRPARSGNSYSGSAPWNGM